TSPSQLWRISYPEGESVRITTDATDYSSVSVSRDAKTIVSIAKNNHLQIWIAPEGDAARARAITTRAGVWSYGLSWTTNGKIVFSSKAGSNLNILLINVDGSNQTQLTVNAGDNYSPVISPDGRFIIFASNRTGDFNIWRMNANDGSDPKQLTFSDGNFYPSCSTDSQWVAYDNQSKATLSLWRIPIDGGEPVQLTDKYARLPVISPDNQFIACRYYIDSGQLGIAIIPAAGGLPVSLLSIPIGEWQRVQWTPDGTALTYIDAVKGVSNIWRYDLASGSKRQLTNFNSDQIFAYGWSPDFKQLACERGTTVSDAMSINP
ncbi:MAG TPA: hypothetical protein VFQ43_01970, partial [Nitrososphaera sp.]|nr:hypothetical protein [Nitrososphaera sp.]